VILNPWIFNQDDSLDPRIRDVEDWDVVEVTEWAEIFNQLLIRAEAWLELSTTPLTFHLLHLIPNSI